MKMFEENPFMSQGVAPMSEPVTVTYMDLERLIDTCGLTDDEKKIVELLMLGYTKIDIKDTTDFTMQNILALYNSAVDKIIEQNEYEWHRCQAARKRLGY